MYIIRKYDDLSLMDTEKEKFEQIFKTESRTMARNKMIAIASGSKDGSWVLTQIDGEVTITLQIIQNRF